MWKKGFANVLAENNSLNTFFHELLVIEKDSEDEITKLIVGLGAQFAKESQSATSETQSGTISSAVNPLEDKVVG